MSKTNFGTKLSDRFDKKRTNKGVFYKGVGLSTASEAKCIVDPPISNTPYTREIINTLRKTGSNPTPEAKTTPKPYTFLQENDENTRIKPLHPHPPISFKAKSEKNNEKSTDKNAETELIDEPTTETINEEEIPF